MTTNTMTNRYQKQGISLLGVGHATSFLLAISFALCISFDLLFPEHAMYKTWQQLLPGFEWLSWKSFFLGLIEAYGYGWFFALIWVPVYNFVTLRGGQEKN
ncbi:MAG: DUF5676 family membrane protein [Gammaproteobacteria bacterium]|nr:DUF5676 family membrane protein [Gammaproteobacteria bacterium]MCF6260229.1 DUF5676 family membrane protein [Gammaproteobacteria bacterium]